jgi:hypothetical protein
LGAATLMRTSNSGAMHVVDAVTQHGTPVTRPFFNTNAAGCCCCSFGQRPRGQY